MAYSAAYGDLFSPPVQSDGSAPVFSVSEFLDMVNELVAPLKPSIQGEITSISVRGMNVFATISDTKAAAKLDLYIHKSKLDNLGIELKEGTEVIIKGTPSIYKQYGKFSLSVTHISLVGEGALKTAFDRLVAKLNSEGLFDESLKRKVPEFPVNIGVVSSSTADALFDFKKHLLPFNLKIHFVDARVEGVNAIDSIVQALRVLNESNIPLDVIVVTRGGGSLESLQAFNSELIAKAIRSSRVPVISAVGHEQDVTIADYVADLRASTPTDAAKILSNNWSKASEKVQFIQRCIASDFRKSFLALENKIDGYLNNMLSNYQQELTYQQNIVKHAQSHALAYLQNVQFMTKKIENDFGYNLKTYESVLAKSKLEIAQSAASISISIQNLVRQTSVKIDNIEQLIAGNDPHNKLKQGYSIVTNFEGKVVKTADDIELNSSIKLKLFKGSLESTVTKKSN